MNGIPCSGTALIRCRERTVFILLGAVFRMATAVLVGKGGRGWLIGCRIFLQGANAQTTWS